MAGRNVPGVAVGKSMAKVSREIEGITHDMNPRIFVALMLLALMAFLAGLRECSLVRETMIFRSIPRS
jgi:hypothetical protein